jgi:hypothetical protein
MSSSTPRSGKPIKTYNAWRQVIATFTVQPNTYPVFDVAAGMSGGAGAAAGDPAASPVSVSDFGASLDPACQAANGS